MLTKSQFQTLFGFKPKRRISTKSSKSKKPKKSVSKAGKKVVKKSVSKAGKKVVKKSVSKAGKKVAKKSNKVGTRIIKGVKRTVYKGKKGGKFYKKADGRKVYFGPSTVMIKAAGQVVASKALEGIGYTLGFRAANTGLKIVNKSLKKKKPSAMGRKKMVAGKKRTVYKSAGGSKYYKSAKGNKVYFGQGQGGHGRKVLSKLRSINNMINGNKTSVFTTAADARAAAAELLKAHTDIATEARGAAATARGDAYNQRDTAHKVRIAKAKLMPEYAAAKDADVLDSILDGADLPATTVVFGRRIKKRRRGTKRRVLHYKSKRNTRFGNHGNVKLENSMGPSYPMFGSYDPILI